MGQWCINFLNFSKKSALQFIHIRCHFCVHFISSLILILILWLYSFSLSSILSVFHLHILILKCGRIPLFVSLTWRCLFVVMPTSASFTALIVFIFELCLYALVERTLLQTSVNTWRRVLGVVGLYWFVLKSGVCLHSDTQIGHGRSCLLSTRGRK